tara:strand:+ start:1031 stop:2635 length:1605 start_codon:yes stop_codon:yes gene_type:complete
MAKRPRQQRIESYGEFRPTGVDDSAARRMQALAGLGDTITDVAEQFGRAKATELAPEQALEDVRKAKEEGTELKKKNPFAWGASTYNATLQKAYVDSKELDFAEQASRIATENPTDVIAFDRLIAEQAKVTLSNVQPEFEGHVKRRVELISANTSAKIYGQQVSRNIEEANQLSISNIEIAQSDMLRAANSGLVDQSQEMYDDILLMLDARVIAGQELEGTVVTQKQELSSALQGEWARSILRKTYQDNGSIAASAWIQDIADNPAKDFTVAQQDSLISVLKSDLTQTLNLSEIGQQQAVENLKAKQKSNAIDLLEGILEGEVGLDRVIAEGKSTGIDFTDFMRLSEVLKTDGQGFDDFTIINNIQNLITTNPDEAERLTMMHINTGIETATGKSLLAAIRDAKSGESRLQTNEAKRFRDFVYQQISVTGSQGSIISDKLAKRANLVLVYDDRVLNGEDPRDVAAELIQARQDILRPPESFEEALKKLNAEAEETGMDSSIYNNRYDTIREESQGNDNYRQYKAYLNELTKVKN